MDKVKQIQIFVTNANNEESSLKIDDNCRTDKLFELIAEKIKCRAGQLKLTHGGQQIQVGKSIQDYEIKEGSHIKVTLRLRGGY